MRLLLLVVALPLTGCTGAVYWPNIAHAPMLAEKGDASLSAHGSPIQLQGSVAYAVTDHFAVRAQGDGRISFTAAGEGNSSFDAGIGWFTAESPKRGWRLGLAVDAGVGEVRNVRTDAFVERDDDGGQNDEVVVWDVDRFETEFRRVSGQIEGGIQEEGFLVGGLLRVSAVEGDLRYTSTLDESATEEISWVLVEPIGFIRMRLRHGLAWEIQLGGSLPSKSVGPAAEAGVVWPFVAAIGLVGDF